MTRWALAAVVLGWFLLMQVSLASAAPPNPGLTVIGVTTATVSLAPTCTTTPATTPAADATPELRLRRPAPPSATAADLPTSSPDVALPDARAPPRREGVEAAGSTFASGGVPARVTTMAGRRGSAATRAQLDVVRDELLAAEPELVLIGGGRHPTTGMKVPEEWVPNRFPVPGNRGAKGRFVDMTFRAPDGSRVRVQTVDVAPRRPSGMSYDDEQAEAALLQASRPGDRLIIIGKDPRVPIDVNVLLKDLLR